MSSARVVSAVTAALRNRLDLATRDNPAGTSVTARPPDRARAPNGGNQLNVFLYQTTVNAAWRNADMPGRVKPGETAMSPLPLTLHYLLTAYGDNEEDVLAHHVLGRAMSVLHDRPIMAPDEIRRALPNGAFPPALEQTEGIRITFQPLTLDEMSKLWTTLQTQYRVSATYQVSVVLIEPADPGRAPLPVLRQGGDGRGPTAVTGVTPPFPGLTAVIAPEPGFSAQLGDTLVLRGHRLAGDTVEVSFRHAQLGVRNDLPPLAGAGADELSVTLPDDAAAAAAWPAGVYTVSVRVTTTVAGQQVEHETGELPLALAPRIETIVPNPVTRDAAGDIALTITFVPELRLGQRAALVLGSREVPPQPPPDPPPPRTGSLDFVAGGLAPDDYYVRIRIAGVDSILQDRAADPPAFDDAQKVTVQ